MAKIIVNDETSANGKLSVSRSINEKKNGFIISGVFATHLYYESIKSLESKRFLVSGIEVITESFGSDDYEILYHFTAKIFKLNDIIEDGIGFILYPEEMEEIEEEMYKDEHPILGDIGSQYKDMVKKEKEGEVDDDN